MELSFKLPFVNVRFVLYEGPALQKALPDLLKLAAAKVVVAAMRALASLCTLVGISCCKSALSYKARRFEALYVVHNPVNRAYPPLPVLVQSRNVAAKQVITREEDVKAIQAMKAHFIQQNPGWAHNEKLQKSRCRGAHSTGICYGATAVFLKKCLKASITSEDDLKQIAKTFEEGFPAVAEGVQAIQKKTRHLLGEAVNAFSDAFTQTQKLFEATHTNAPDESRPALREKYTEERNEHLKKFASRMIEHENRILKTYDLEITNQAHQLDECTPYGADGSEELMKERFNALPNGLYQLQFKRHAACYLKFDFGSYFFDPNHGLMTTGTKTPAQACLALLNSAEGINWLYAYRIGLRLDC